ncbi:hypothetical protein [Bacillus sp. 165]|uniref:hypothetical protein n=1 Tax=Bacillus sp. 165 TaxID=1529117 RepID=UPI001ADA149B|nr:hypothetical protein [Bacillus sp. 165]MBO9129531.1 hypothetical protein [Bacillus sp. 165]
MLKYFLLYAGAILVFIGAFIRHAEKVIWFPFVCYLIAAVCFILQALLLMRKK